MMEYIIRLKRKTRNIFQDGWVWKMAWRDARQNMPRLFLFIASLITGIAAVVALDSLNTSLQDDINRNAKELLGADLVVKASKKFDPKLVAIFDSIQYRQADETFMASMVLFMNSGQSRLIRLVALRGDFPFYGTIETLPDDAYEKLKSRKGIALLDESLASQYEVSSGDSVRLGNSKFLVGGVVRKIPGGSAFMSTFTPSVYISMSDLEATGLIQFGSRVDYRRYFKTETKEQADALVKWLGPEVRKYGHGYDDVEERKKELGDAFQSVYQFFSLLAFVALILGCIGVASSVHIYAREKREEVAVLRCVGSSGWQAFNIYFIQIFLLGVAGSIAGSFLGIGIQQLIPVVFADFLPVEVSFSISWLSVLQGVVLGTFVSVLFSMLPLLSVRFVPPLAVLRADFEVQKTFSKARLATLVFIILFPLAFAAWQTRSLLNGSLFFAGLIAALACLTLVAWALLKIVKRFFPSGATFVWRHALANLFRPNNQTRMLMVAIGLGTFIIATLNVVQQSLLSQVEFTGQENQSNTILFDIQPSQKDGIVQLMNQNNLPVNQVVPIITCRLSQVKGKSIEELQKDTVNRIQNWALTREYRVTYRDSLHKSEELVSGSIQHKYVLPDSLKDAQSTFTDSVWVTISEGMHEELHVKEGDSLVFDVQGVPVKARISGVRKVDWSNDPPNFIFVFPTGVLEHAPQIYVAATRIDKQESANVFQQELVMQFPNVSLIDLRLILSTVNNLFDKLAVIVRFLALFSIVTGLVVLAGAVINSKYLRMKENVLLRTIGARTRHINAITLIEYAYVGLFASLTGTILSLGSGWLLMTFFFKIQFEVNGLGLLMITMGVMCLTMLIGWWNSRGVINTPPLQVLRKEN
jgi:putative ABC transport system permease protein